MRGCRTAWDSMDAVDDGSAKPFQVLGGDQGFGEFIGESVDVDVRPVFFHDACQDLSDTSTV